MCQLLLDFGLHIVRYDNSSVYVQGWHGLCLLLPTGLDRHFDSGYRLVLDCSQIAGPGRQLSRTVDSGTVALTSPYLSELGGFSAGYTAGQSENSYNMLVFAIRLLYSIKIDHLTCSNHILRVLHLARSTIF
jgi:hypothetical protein